MLLGFWVRLGFSLGSRDFLPFKTRPLFESFLGPSLFFCCLVVFSVRRRRVSLFFSPLQALVKHRPRCGLWFPLCSPPGHAQRPRPVRLAPHFPQGHRPHLFFFVVWFRCRRLALSLSLSLSLSLWCRSPVFACKYQRRHETWGWPTRRLPQLSS